MQTRDKTLDAVHHLACGMGYGITAAFTGLTEHEVMVIAQARKADIAERRHEYRLAARQEEMFEARYAGDDE